MNSSIWPGDIWRNLRFPVTDERRLLIHWWYFSGFMVCYFFCLIFVSMGVPGGPVCQGVFRGSSGSVLVVFMGCSGVFLACSWFHRHPEKSGEARSLRLWIKPYGKYGVERLKQWNAYQDKHFKKRIRNKHEILYTGNAFLLICN